MRFILADIGSGIQLCTRTIFVLFFFNDTATTEIYTLSLHDALPISFRHGDPDRQAQLRLLGPHQSRHAFQESDHAPRSGMRSEEHTSELQSHLNLVFRLFLENKNFAQDARPVQPRRYDPARGIRLSE